MGKINLKKKRKGIKKKVKEDEKNSKREGEEETGKSESERRERERFLFCFSLRSREIEPYIFIRSKGKVSPRIESYAWVPKSWSFVKLREVRNFPTWVISSLKAI